MLAPPLGRHVLVEFYECDTASLSGVADVENAMLCAADAARATIITHNFHQFEPYGVSGVVVISESHLTIHTWPEYGYAAIDIFFCSPDNDPEAAIEVMAEVFRPSRRDVQWLERGRLDQVLPGVEHAPKVAAVGEHKSDVVMQQQRPRLRAAG